MAKAMKYHPHGRVLFCTVSLEEGLLLLANPLCQAVIKSCIARAQTLHPVRICHFIVETTHVHIVLVVDKPDDVHAFFRCFKTESAHMINGCLGRGKRTVWCEGYDSPVVLTPVRALAAIAYLYANPAKDNLETSIDKDPGFSSWQMYQSGETTCQYKRLRRPQFSLIPRDAHNLRSENLSVRVAFIRFFKALMHRARAVQQRWKIGGGCNSLSSWVVPSIHAEAR